MNEIIFKFLLFLIVSISFTIAGCIGCKIGEYLHKKWGVDK